MADYYLPLRHLHIACALFSIAGFFLRGMLLLGGSPLPSRRWVRRLTDSNDALLLLAAVGLVVATGQYPFVAPWLTAKVLALLLYIGLGFAAFRLLHAFRYRLAAWLSALVVAAYILSVAVSKNPYGFFAFFL